MGGIRVNHLLPPPPTPKYKLVHIGFTSPGGWAYNRDKDKHGHRYDSIGICNGVINAGASCDRLQYDPNNYDAMVEKLNQYDGYIVRINPGQLSNPGVIPGAQAKFDALMRSFVKQGKPVWSSPAVQTQMGAKDALVKISKMSSGLEDTYAYYTEEELQEGFRRSAAFQPRVIKQNRGSAGEGIWLVWLKDKPYCRNLGDATLKDNDVLKLMEMNDNHIEYHTVAEFLEFCVHGPTKKAGTWKTGFPGRYLNGNKDSGGQIVDMRLLPRIQEGEVRMLMVKDSLFQIIHKKPTPGNFSAVGGINIPTFYPPDAPKYADLKKKFIEEDVPKLLDTMGLSGEPLPLIWTSDFIPADGPEPGSTQYIVGEFNCSCVGISNFSAGCGPGKDINDVSDDNYYQAMSLCNLIGKQAIEALDEMKAKKAFDRMVKLAAAALMIAAVAARKFAFRK